MQNPGRCELSRGASVSSFRPLERPTVQPIGFRVQGTCQHVPVLLCFLLTPIIQTSLITLRSIFLGPVKPSKSEAYVAVPTLVAKPST